MIDLRHPFTVLVLLVFWHAWADYPGQGDTVAREKNPASTTPLQAHVPWFWWMGAHVCTHAAGVLLITRSWWCVAAELVTHWALDLGKCKGRITLAQDQAGHLAMKAIYVAGIWWLS